jgi:hypothetical protein
MAPQTGYISPETTAKLRNLVDQGKNETAVPAPAETQGTPVEAAPPAPVASVSPAPVQETAPAPARAANPLYLKGYKVPQARSFEQGTGKSAIDAALDFANAPEEDRRLLSKDVPLPNLDKKLGEIKDAYDQRVSEMGERQAKVAMFSILGHIAVGLYGVKHGVDTSGNKFDVTDWSVQYKRIMDQYNMEKDIAKTEYETKESRRDKYVSLAKFLKGEFESKEARKVSDLTEEAKFVAGGAREEQRQASFEERAANREEAMSARAEERNVLAREKEARIAEQKKVESIRNVMFKAESQKSTDAKLGMMETAAAEIPSTLSFDEWKNWDGADKGWLSSDEEDYMHYVRNNYKNYAKSIAAPTDRASSSTASAPSAIVTKAPQSGATLVERVRPNGKTALFNATTKKFVKDKD